jgi:hypothetical protein
VDLSAAADQVYGAAPEDFMAVRTALVAQARQAKDRDLAKAVAALRKPTRSAWMINLLARSEPDEVARLLELGAALRDAQSRLANSDARSQPAHNDPQPQSAGAELRRLSSERHRAVAALARRATVLAAEHGHTASDTQRQEIVQHLQAALSDPQLAEDVRAGRVVQITTVGGFGPWDARSTDPGGPAAGVGEVSAVPRPRAEASTDAATTEEPVETETAERTVSTDDEPSGPNAAEVDAAHEAWQLSAEAVHDAESAAEQAADAADAAARELTRLRTALAAAEQVAEQADRRRSEAREQVATLREQADAAQRRLDELRSHLEK